MAKHPDFADIQSRLRRLNPDWYPAGVQIDQEYGHSMAKGIDAALDQLEASAGLPQWSEAKQRNGVILLEPKFRFLTQQPMAPLMVHKALELLGTVEKPGSGNNAVIVDWADEVADIMDTGYAQWAAEWYQQDSIPWCGLFQAVVAVRSANGRADRLPPVKYLSALEWQGFGVAVPKEQAAVGDVMVMKRRGGGHVCTNVGMEQGGRRFFGLGGNQQDTVNILPFEMSRVVAVRRPPYNNRPAGARQVFLSKDGRISSVNEA